MSLTIELTTQAEAWVNAQAQLPGLRPTDFARNLIEERAATSTPAHSSTSGIDAENAAAIAMLNQWIAEDATDDPEEIRRVDEEVEELKRNLNANRAATEERLVFP